MKKVTFYTGLLLSASILLSACQQQEDSAISESESSSQEITTSEELTPTSLSEGALPRKYQQKQKLPKSPIRFRIPQKDSLQVS